MNIFLRKLIKATKLFRTPMYRRALARGVGAAIEHEPLLKFLYNRQIELVFDVGANIGQFSLAVRQCLPNAQIVAFEPLAEPAKRFCSIFKNDDKATLNRGAIGPITGEVDMHVSKSIDSSSVLPIGPRQSELFPGTMESHREKVMIAPLETWIDKSRLNKQTVLKIDVQGYELEVLRGCESVLDSIQMVYVECSFVELYEGQALADEIVSYLAARGFRFAGVYNLSYSPQGLAVQGDFLFKNIGSSDANQS